MDNRINIEKDRRRVILWSKQNSEWIDNTLNITAIYKKYLGKNHTGYNIYFRDSSMFFYTKEKVRIAEIIEKVNLKNYDIYIKQNQIDALEVTKVFIHDEGKSYIIKTSSGLFFHYKIIIKKRDILEDLSSVPYKEVITTKKAVTPKIFDYYKDIASYAGQIASADEPLSILSNRYSRITQNKQSVLESYFQGQTTMHYRHMDLIMPFDFNQSQLKAIEKALISNISVIEGPPGTGKTQTILNLISNILMKNETCAVISSNNAAIENVYDKLKEVNFDYIAAKLGSMDRVDDFFEQVDDSEIENIKQNKIEVKNEHYVKLKNAHEQIKSIQRKEIEIAKTEKTINQIEVEYNNFKKLDYLKVPIKDELTSNDYKKLIITLEHKKVRWLRKFFIKYKYKIKEKNILSSDVLYSLEGLFYEKKIKELTELRNQYVREVEVHKRLKPYESIKDVSTHILKSKIYNHYKGIEGKEFDVKNYKQNYYAFIKRFPVVLSTSQSIISNAPDQFLFDYLIIEEASQTDLLSSIMAMNVAKNLVVVGDSKQLQQIDETRLYEISDKLANHYQISKGYQYKENSILKSVIDVVSVVPITLLKQHYRSAPDIIEFCNQMFYNNELIAMTQNKGTHIEIIKTVPGHHARKNPYGTGMYNQREIDEIESILKYKQDLSDIGVVSPFRYQADLVINKFSHTNLESDTVHKFQGRQKNEIILSFVVNELEKDPEMIENRLYDFINNKELLNVAISRAKHKVTVIVSDKLYHSSNNLIKDFINYAEYLYGSNVIKESTIVSAFDYLYEANNEELIKLFGTHPKMYKSEQIMYEIVKEVLSQYPKIGFVMHNRLSKIVSNLSGFSQEEINYIKHPWTHVDFLFYNKVTKENLFVIEVDGIKYHEQNNQQTLKDGIKNKVLGLNHIEIHRFRTNESNEKNRLASIVRQFDY